LSAPSAMPAGRDILGLKQGGKGTVQSGISGTDNFTLTGIVDDVLAALRSITEERPAHYLGAEEDRQR
jgi:hypothetical protein